MSRKERKMTRHSTKRGGGRVRTLCSMNTAEHSYAMGASRARQLIHRMEAVTVAGSAAVPRKIRLERMEVAR